MLMSDYSISANLMSMMTNLVTLNIAEKLSNFSHKGLVTFLLDLFLGSLGFWLLL